MLLLLQKEGVHELTTDLMETRLAMGVGDTPFVRELLRQLGLSISVKTDPRLCFCGKCRHQLGFIDCGLLPSITLRGFRNVCCRPKFASQQAQFGIN